MLAGLADSTMSRDDGWRFLVLGRSLERVDMTAACCRPGTARAGAKPGWVTTLRCCGAYEAFLRTYRRAVDGLPGGRVPPARPALPRSVFSALRTAEDCLAELDPPSDRAGLDDEARRILGRARTELEFRRVDDLVADLPGHLYRLQQHCFDAGTAVAAATSARPPPWSGAA